MKDAELMTTEATVPGLEVKIARWVVTVGGIQIGDIFPLMSTPLIDARVGNDWTTHATRNEAVKWILDQHKKGEK